MNQIIIAIIGSGALTALITNIFTMLKDRKDKSHGIAEGVQLLLYDRIKYLSKATSKTARSARRTSRISPGCGRATTTTSKATAIWTH